MTARTSPTLGAFGSPTSESHDGLLRTYGTYGTNEDGTTAESGSLVSNARTSNAMFGDPRLPVRVWSKLVVNEAGCWVWVGATSPAGYGRSTWTTDRKRAVLAHRLTYEQLVGTIPEGLTIDHLCRVRACCNPAHLEAVTNRVNVLRGQTVTAINAAKTTCSSGGHPLSGDNLRITAAGRRKCRTCQRLTQRAARERKR